MSDPLVGPSPPVLTSQLKQIIERPDLDAAVWRRAVVGGGGQTKLLKKDAAKEYNINSQVTVKELPPLSQQKKKMGS